MANLGRRGSRGSSSLRLPLLDGTQVIQQAIEIIEVINRGLRKLHFLRLKPGPGDGVTADGLGDISKLLCDDGQE